MGDIKIGCVFLSVVTSITYLLLFFYHYYLFAPIYTAIIVGCPA